MSVYYGKLEETKPPTAKQFAEAIDRAVPKRLCADCERPLGTESVYLCGGCRVGLFDLARDLGVEFTAQKPRDPKWAKMYYETIKTCAMVALEQRANSVESGTAIAALHERPETQNTCYECRSCGVGAVAGTGSRYANASICPICWPLVGAARATPPCEACARYEERVGPGEKCMECRPPRAEQLDCERRVHRTQRGWMVGSRIAALSLPPAQPDLTRAAHELAARRWKTVQSAYRKGR